MSLNISTAIRTGSDADDHIIFAVICESYDVELKKPWEIVTNSLFEHKGYSHHYVTDNRQFCIPGGNLVSSAFRHLKYVFSQFVFRLCPSCSVFLIPQQGDS